jgi:hypothetical protein
VIHPDGRVTLNGIANFNTGVAPGTVVSGIPTGDGFIVLNLENVLPTVDELLAEVYRQVLFFQVTDAELNESSAEILEDTKVYVKVGSNLPLLIVEFTYERYATLYAEAFPTEAVPPEGEISFQLQVCTALANNLFIVVGQVPREVAGRCYYAAVCSSNGVLAEQIFGAAILRPGDPTTIAWKPGLAQYQDWLPTTEDQITLPDPAGALYQEFNSNVLPKINATGDRVVLQVDPENTVLPNKSPNATLYPLEPFITGATVPMLVDDEERSLALSFPFAVWTQLGLGGLNVYGYLENDFGDLESVTIFELYEDPTIADRPSLYPGVIPGLILSPNSGTNAWQTAPYKLFSMPTIKPIVG